MKEAVCLQDTLPANQFGVHEPQPDLQTRPDAGAPSRFTTVTTLPPSSEAEKEQVCTLPD